MQREFAPSPFLLIHRVALPLSVARPLHANWQTSAGHSYRDRPPIFANYDARPTPREPAEPRSPIPCPLISKRAPSSPPPSPPLPMHATRLPFLFLYFFPFLVSSSSSPSFCSFLLPSSLSSPLLLLILILLFAPLYRILHFRTYHVSKYVIFQLRDDLWCYVMGLSVRIFGYCYFFSRVF